MTITCSFDMGLTTIEWLYNGDVIEMTTGSQVNLTFSPVNDIIHKREYTCLVNTSHGIQEESITIQVQSRYTHVYELND